MVHRKRAGRSCSNTSNPIKIITQHARFRGNIQPVAVWYDIKWFRPTTQLHLVVIWGVTAAYAASCRTYFVLSSLKVQSLFTHTNSHACNSQSAILRQRRQWSKLLLSFLTVAISLRFHFTEKPTANSQRHPITHGFIVSSFERSERVAYADFTLASGPCSQMKYTLIKCNENDGTRRKQHQRQKDVSWYYEKKCSVVGIEHEIVVAAFIVPFAVPH